MKLENQVCSLELAKKLKELGVKKESLFYHLEDTFGDKTYRGIVNEIGNNPKGGNTYYSAFTVAELGEMLPEYYLTMKALGKWHYGKQKATAEFIDMDYTEADARAKLLIYLLENKLI